MSHHNLIGHLPRVRENAGAVVRVAVLLAPVVVEDVICDQPLVQLRFRLAVFAEGRRHLPLDGAESPPGTCALALRSKLVADVHLDHTQSLHDGLRGEALDRVGSVGADDLIHFID